MLRSFKNNLTVWNDKSSVGVYGKANGRLANLFAPEIEIFKTLSKDRRLKVLDLGVGAGRTTKYLAELSIEYVGIDYSKGMIEIAKHKYKDYNNVKFYVADAQNLNFLEDEYFDFIIFSYNGIDYVDYDSRIKIFKEIYRLTKFGGRFCFSTHNLN